MAISINKIVRDDIASLAEPIPTIAMRGMCITTNPLIPVGLRYLRFNDAETVGEFFGTNSQEYENATAYFSSFVGKLIYQQKPTVMYFGRAVMESVAPYLRGDAKPVFADFKAARDGEVTFYFSEDGYPVSFTMADYNSWSDVATAIQTQLIAGGLTTATATFDAIGQCFFISNGVNGADSTVGFASDGAGSPALAEIMKLTLDTFATLSQGADPETFVQTFAAITNKVKTFNGFWFLYDVSDDYYFAMLDYIANSNNSYMNYKDVASIAQAGALILKLEARNYAKQVELSTGKLIYRFNVPICINITPSNLNRLSANVNGVFNSWAVTQPNSFLSPVNKQFATLVADNWTNEEYEEIIALGCNCYGLVDGGYVQRSVYRLGNCGNTGSDVGEYGSQTKLSWFYIENYIRTGVQTTLLVKMTDGRTLSDLANDTTGRSAVISWITQFLSSCVYNPVKGYPSGNGMINPTDVLAEGINGEYELEQLSVKFNVDIQTINNAFDLQGFFVKGIAENFDSKLESTMYINFAYVVTGDVSTIICTQIPVI